jgi:hypothetical protein
MMTNMNVDAATIQRITGRLTNTTWSDFRLPIAPLVIVGHHGCGKDTVAQIICSLTNKTYLGSLSFMVAPYLYGLFKEFGIVGNNVGFDRFYANRHDYSGYIQHTLNTIRVRNPGYVLAVARECEIITGVRTLAEIELLASQMASFVWVCREVEEDPTLEYRASDILDSVDSVDYIQNNGDLWDLVRNISCSDIVRRFAKVEV